MNLRTRLAKLESMMIKPAAIRMSRFIIAPGNLEPDAYRCGDIVIIKLPKETHKAFTKRCSHSVNWPDVTHRHVFKLVEESGCH
jgi:hypothetical protein